MVATRTELREQIVAIMMETEPSIISITDVNQCFYTFNFNGKMLLEVMIPRLVIVSAILSTKQFRVHSGFMDWDSINLFDLMDTTKRSLLIAKMLELIATATV